MEEKSTEEQLYYLTKLCFQSIVHQLKRGHCDMSAMFILFSFKVLYMILMIRTDKENLENSVFITWVMGCEELCQRDLDICGMLKSKPSQLISACSSFEPWGKWISVSGKKVKKKIKLEYLPRVTFLSAERLLFFHA